MALLAVLPVHAIYAGFVLRESLVALDVDPRRLDARPRSGTRHGRRASGAGPSSAGLCGGLAILRATRRWRCWRRRGLYALVRHGRRRPRPAAALGGVVGPGRSSPGPCATLREYGRPFYSYTNYFEYNFSWTVHHYEQGNTRPSQFYTWANAPEIVRVKFKSLLIIVVYSTMIVGLPLAAGYLYRLRSGDRDAPGPGRRPSLSATIFVVFVRRHAQERRRRDPGGAARPLLPAGLTP